MAATQCRALPTGILRSCQALTGKPGGWAACYGRKEGPKFLRNRDPCSEVGRLQRGDWRASCSLLRPPGHEKCPHSCQGPGSTGAQVQPLGTQVPTLTRVCSPSPRAAQPRSPQPAGPHNRGGAGPAPHGCTPSCPVSMSECVRDRARPAARPCPLPLQQAVGHRVGLLREGPSWQGSHTCSGQEAEFSRCGVPLPVPSFSP